MEINNNKNCFVPAKNKRFRSHFDYVNTTEDITSEEEIKILKKYQEDGHVLLVRLKLVDEWVRNDEEKLDTTYMYRVLEK